MNDEINSSMFVKSPGFIDVMSLQAKTGISKLVSKYFDQTNR